MSNPKQKDHLGKLATLRTLSRGLAILWLATTLTIALGCAVRKATVTTPPTPEGRQAVTQAAPQAVSPADDLVQDTEPMDDNNPMPPGSTSPRSQVEQPHLTAELCANGQQRTKRGACPSMPGCAKRCILGNVNLKTCGYQTDPPPSTYLAYSSQKSNGKTCAWTFAPVGKPQ